MHPTRLTLSTFVGTFTAAFLFAITAHAQTFNVKSYAAPAAQHVRAVDLNSDGFPDLLLFGDNQAVPAGGTNPGTPLAVMLNDGKGGFLAATTLDQNGYRTVAAVVADLNGDGRPDIAACEGGPQFNNQNYLNIYLNGGGGKFALAHTINVPTGCTTIAVGNADNNNIPDLVVGARDSGEGNEYDNVLVTYFGDGKGDFPTSAVQQSVPLDGSRVNELCGLVDIAGADFDGDGILDLVIVTSCGNANNTSSVFVAKGDGTGHYAVTELFQSADDLSADEPYVSDVNFDGRPDVILVGRQATPGSNSHSGDVWFLINDSNNGIFRTAFVFQVQSNSSTYADRVFAGAAGNFNGDSYQDAAVGYTKSGQPALGVLYGSSTRDQYATPVALPTPGGFPISLAAADFSHSGSTTGLAALEQSASGSYTIVTYLFTGSAGQTCSAPSSVGVNVCSPTAGGTVGSPVNVVAAGTGASGSVNHLELWIDGQKIGNYPGASMNTSVTLANGAHSATVVEVDSQFHYVKSSPVNFTVAQGGGGGSCQAPSSPGAVLCTPAAGSTELSPVQFTGAGTGASGSVNHLELWIDGNKIGNYQGSMLNTQVPLPVGTHNATLVEVDSQFHYIKSTPDSFTVK